MNTYILNNPKLIANLRPIDHIYGIKRITWDDEQMLKDFYSDPKRYARKIPKRMNSPEWVGLSVIDTTNGNIAYIAWVITKSIKYFEEFGVKLKNGQFLLKDGFCHPEYRHQGLHTRMEQERINYCIKNGAHEIFVQIHDSNKGGINSVLNNGYKLYQQNYVIQWPVFHVYRSLKGFLRNPFKKVVK
ncbi:MAG: hypothetical protein ACLFVR_08690 [Thiohalospira sp.]